MNSCHIACWEIHAVHNELDNRSCDPLGGSQSAMLEEKTQNKILAYIRGTQNKLLFSCVWKLKVLMDQRNSMIEVSKY